MKINQGYLLREINGTPYLLPVGQNIALHKKSLFLNESGVIIWNAISQNVNIKLLAPLLASYYQTDPDDVSLQDDIRLFLEQMIAMELIYPEKEPSTDFLYFSIGNLIIQYVGPKELLHPSLFDFSCEPSPHAQIWQVINNPPPIMPLGEKLIYTSEIEILRTPTEYILRGYPSNHLTETRLSLDGTLARFYCVPEYDTSLQESLFHAFRFAFLMMAQKHGYFALHSASILYRDKAWLFTGPSGTGKSTHASLWENTFSITHINGDLNLIHIEDSNPMLYGIPWCGTSGQYDTRTYPLGGITLLKQHDKNMLKSPPLHECGLIILNRLISPTWEEEMLDNNLNFSMALSNKIPVFKLLCRKEPLAAHLMKETIDTLKANER